MKHDPNCAIVRLGDIRAWCDCGTADELEYSKKAITKDMFIDMVLDEHRVRLPLHQHRAVLVDLVNQTEKLIVDWLRKEQEEYPKSEYSGFVAMIAEEIEAGEHLK